MAVPWIICVPVWAPLEGCFIFFSSFFFIFLHLVFLPKTTAFIYQPWVAQKKQNKKRPRVFSCLGASHVVDFIPHTTTNYNIPLITAKTKQLQKIYDRAPTMRTPHSNPLMTPKLQKKQKQKVNAESLTIKGDPRVRRRRLPPLPSLCPPAPISLLPFFSVGTQKWFNSSNTTRGTASTSSASKNRSPAKNRIRTKKGQPEHLHPAPTAVRSREWINSIDDRQ